MWADVGVTGDSITTVDDLTREPAGQTVGAAGLTVAPGFIDMHSHSDWRLFANRCSESKIRQGVTTKVVGNCGFSPAHVSHELREDMQDFALFELELPLHHTSVDNTYRAIRISRAG